MGEYVNYAGERIKIGTCENLYYASFDKYLEAIINGKLEIDEFKTDPREYALPDSGYRFRFPFPDEDEVPLPDMTNVADFERGLLITIERGEVFGKNTFPELGKNYVVNSKTQPDLRSCQPMVNPNNITELVSIEIVQQRLITHENGLRLVLCYRCPFADETWRLEELEEATFVSNQIITHYANKIADLTEADFWTKVAERILKGYPSSGMDLTFSL